MALLALAHAIRGDAIVVATVDHGLRPEAARECAMVVRVCEQRAIACDVIRVTVGKGNLQDRARAARYAALGDWAAREGLNAIATAHHADDQAETLLMRLNRGAGLGGLAGIRASTAIDGCAVPVIRPLLGFRKRELAAIITESGLPSVQDPSNRDESFDRVRMRAHLAKAEWIDPAALARSAAHLAEAEATLQAMADDIWQAEAVVRDEAVIVPETRHAEITARLVARAMATLGGESAPGETAAFLKKLARRGNFAGILIEREAGGYRCSREPPRRSG